MARIINDVIHQGDREKVGVYPILGSISSKIRDEGRGVTIK